MLRLSVKSVTCILILGILAVPLYSANEKDIATPQKGDIFSLYLEAEPNQKNVKEIPWYNKKEVFRVQPEPVVTDKDIASIKFQNGDQKTNGITINLNVTGRLSFYKATKENINKRLAVVVDGRVISAPVIKVEIPGDSISLHSPDKEVLQMFKEHFQDSLPPARDSSGVEGTEEKESLNSEIYASDRKATEIIIEMEVALTSLENLTGKYEKLLPSPQKDEDGGKSQLLQFAISVRDLQSIDDLFKDKNRVEKFSVGDLRTFSEREVKKEVYRHIYYIADATVDENGDITCKIRKAKNGMLFRVFPKISEEDPNLIKVEYEFELNTLVKKVPSISAIAGIRELEPLWTPIMNMRSSMGVVILKDGEGAIIGNVYGNEPSEREKNPENILGLTILTAKKGKTGVVTGPPRRVKAITP